MSVVKCVAKKVELLMQENKLTAREFSKVTNIPYSTLKKILDLRGKEVRVKTVLKIVETFDLRLDDFLKEYIEEVRLDV